MGILRVLLALSVVVDHAGPILGIVSVGGRIAVEAFFIISGFYMSLILDGKYQTAAESFKSYWLFVSNRFLRIFPIYWTMLVVILSTFAVHHYLKRHLAPLDFFPAHLPYLSTAAKAFLAFANVFIFGQALTMFLAFNAWTHSLYYTSNFRITLPPINYFILNPPSWTLDLELTFYLIAPFLLKLRARYVALIIVCSFLLKFFIFQSGYNHDPWTYRFFPTEIGLFLCGNMGYRIYKMNRSTDRIPIWFSWTTLIAIYLLTLFFPLIKVEFSDYLYLVCMGCAVPIVFNLTRNWKWDRWIGELSYPIYICHFFLTGYWGSIAIKYHLSLGLMTAVSSILFSIGLIRFIGDPIEAWRQRRATLEAVIQK